MDNLLQQLTDAKDLAELNHARSEIIQTVNRVYMEAKQAIMSKPKEEGYKEVPMIKVPEETAEARPPFCAMPYFGTERKEASTFHLNKEGVQLT